MLIILEGIEEAALPCLERPSYTDAYHTLLHLAKVNNILLDKFLSAMHAIGCHGLGKIPLNMPSNSIMYSSTPTLPSTSPIL